MGNAGAVPNIWMRTARCGRLLPSFQALPLGRNVNVSCPRVVAPTLDLELRPPARQWGHTQQLHLGLPFLVSRRLASDDLWLSSTRV